MMRLLIILTFLALAVPVHAQEEPAPEPAAASVNPSPATGDPAIWDEISNYRGWKVKSLSLTGPDKTYTGELQKGLELAEENAALYERSLTRDIGRIRLFLALRGYPYSKVSVSVSAREDRREVDLVLDIDPGPPVKVSALEINGLPEDFRETVAEKVKTRAGSVFSDRVMVADELAVLETLRNAGHARARSVSSVEMTDTTTVRLRFDIEPGAVYYFDSFRASGASEDLNNLALISINIKKGERFKPKTVNDARDNISSLQIFRQIRLSLEDTAPDSLAIVVELTERQHRTIEVAGGYWSDDGFSARVRWRHANLFKRGRGSSIELSYTQYKKSGKWVSWWPALFSANILGTLRIGYDDINEDSFDKSAPGIGMGLSYSHSRTMKSSIGYVIERASYTIKTTEMEYFEDPEGPVGWFFYRFVRDGTDDRINPMKGTYSWLTLQFGPKGGVSNSSYFLAEINSTAHISITKKLTFATNVHLGGATPITPSMVLLPDKRFYAGGSTSHRGFNRRKLGPLDENGLPLGGEALVTGFVELRFPLFWKFNGAVFTDFGQVWRTYGDFTWDNIEIAVGPAIRIMTPVGPLRFDLGYRLTDYEPNEPEYAFHFAIGYPM
jgi:outer membrane protein insertion porin family